MNRISMDEILPLDRFAAERPSALGGSVVTSNELLGEALSRRQLEICVEGGQLLVRNVGRCPLWINGSLQSRAHVGPGDTVYIQQQLLLLCVSRPRSLPSLQAYPREELGTFGAADADGLVGESPAMWRLRQQLAQYGSRDGHVLVVGKSGTGKELVARALHRLSPQRHQRFVAENIATVPPSIGTALLFGNRRNFPNPGMEERPGLIGLATGGMLFLDEIGDMHPEAQPLLLRVMERSGEYVRLGEEGQPRRAEVRFLGATNHPERLRPELRRRFHHEIHVPDLSERREDIPLLIRHILKSRALSHPELGRHLLNGQPRIDPRLLDQLVRHSYSTHVAELGFLIDQAAAGDESDVLLPLRPEILLRRTEAQSPERTKAPSAGSAVASSAPPDASVPTAPGSATSLPSSEQAQQALDQAAGYVARAATLLGISRHQMHRLIRRHRLVVRRHPDELSYEPSDEPSDEPGDEPGDAGKDE